MNLSPGEQAAMGAVPVDMVDREPAPYPSGTRWIAVAILFLISIVSVLDRHILTLLVVPIQKQVQLSDVQMSMLIGLAFALPSGLASIPLGWAVDRYSRRAIIATSVAIWSCATALTGLARGYAVLLVARAGVGVGEASLVPAQASLVCDLFPRRELGFATSISNMGFKVGQGVALLIGGTLTYYIVPDALLSLPLVGSMHGWQLIFLLIGVPGLLFVPLIFAIPEPVRSTVQQSEAVGGSGFRDYLAFINRNRRLFLGHHVGFLLFVTMAVAVSSWTPSYLIRVHGWSPSMTGAWLGTVLVIAPILGMPFHGALVDYLYRRGWGDIHMRYPMFAAAAGCPIGIAAFLMPDPHLTVLFVGLFLFTISSYASLPLIALLTRLPSRLRGKATSLVMLVCGNGGSILGPLIVGTFTDRVFADPAMVGLSIICALALLAPFICACFYATLAPLRNMA